VPLSVIPGAAFPYSGLGCLKAVEDVFAARLLVVVNAMSLPIMGTAT
jgi:hypothetical protein